MGFVCTVRCGESRIPRTGPSEAEGAKQFCELFFFPKTVPGEGRGEVQVHVSHLNPPVVNLTRVKLK